MLAGKSRDVKHGLKNRAETFPKRVWLKTNQVATEKHR